MKTRRLLSFAIALCTEAMASGACLPAGPSELEAELKKMPAKQLIFFASWCKSCKDHLTLDAARESIFVAVFDEREKADKVVRALFGTNPARCFWDKEGLIAEEYRVKGLPFSFPLRSRINETLR